MKPIRPADLAHRLGIRKSAISNAVTRGKLVKLPSGELDLDDPVNAEYLKRFSLHRGRTTPSTASPARAAAMLERARARYELHLQRYRERRGDYLVSRYFYACLDSIFISVRAALAGLPDRVDWSALNLETELERQVAAVIAARHIRGGDSPIYRKPPVPDPPLPDEAPADLDGARALLDLLAARRHELERWIEAGELIHKEDGKKVFGEFATMYINSLRYLPRRIVGMLSALIASQGLPAAQERLREAIAEELARLDGAMEKIRTIGGKF